MQRAILFYDSFTHVQSTAILSAFIVLFDSQKIEREKERKNKGKKERKKGRNKGRKERKEEKQRRM